MKRQILGILLFFCLVAPLTGAFTWLQVQKHQVRKEIKRAMKSKLSKNELVLIKLSKQEADRELEWEHSGEFEYQGRMYDVVKHETQGDTLYYYCWLDHKETELNKSLDELVFMALNKESKDKNARKQIAQFFKTLYCSETSEWQILPGPIRKIQTDYASTDLSVSGRPPFHPPKVG